MLYLISSPANLSALPGSSSSPVRKISLELVKYYIFSETLFLMLCEIKDHDVVPVLLLLEPSSPIIS